jgi:putative spermidine/putrescine transport system ATP-binding protein
MQVELKAIQEKVGITFIYVTHDQEEALTMSDRVAVFNQGRIEQAGTPAQIYEHPTTAFVAGFVGISNLVHDPLAQALSGSLGTFSIRPEKIRLGEPEERVGAEMCAAEGTIHHVSYLGVHTRYLVDLAGGGQLTVVEQNLHTTSMDALAATGRRVKLIWRRDHNRRIEETA